MQKKVKMDIFIKKVMVGIYEQGISHVPIEGEEAVQFITSLHNTVKDWEDNLWCIGISESIFGEASPEEYQYFQERLIDVLNDFSNSKIEDNYIRLNFDRGYMKYIQSVDRTTKEQFGDAITFDGVIDNFVAKMKLCSIPTMLVNNLKIKNLNPNREYNLRSHILESKNKKENDCVVLSTDGNIIYKDKCLNLQINNPRHEKIIDGLIEVDKSSFVIVEGYKTNELYCEFPKEKKKKVDILDKIAQKSKNMIYIYD